MIDKPEGWIDIWEEEPPRYKDIYFMTGDGFRYKGMLIGFQKLRKCSFHDYNDRESYDCDESLDYDLRVVFWKPCEEEMGED